MGDHQGKLRPRARAPWLKLIEAGLCLEKPGTQASGVSLTVKITAEQEQAAAWRALSPYRECGGASGQAGHPLTQALLSCTQGTRRVHCLWRTDGSKACFSLGEGQVAPAPKTQGKSHCSYKENRNKNPALQGERQEARPRRWGFSSAA